MNQSEDNYSTACIAHRRCNTSKRKHGNRYDPPKHMTEEEKKAWKKEQRKTRNKESAARSRIQKKEKLKELEKQEKDWRTECDLKTKELLEETALDPKTLDAPPLPLVLPSNEGQISSKAAYTTKDTKSDTTKCGNRYEPKKDMTEEELAKWRKEQRKKRNRESTARSRQKKKSHHKELEQDVEHHWKGIHAPLSKSVELLKKAAIASKTNDVPSRLSTGSDEHEVAHLKSGLSSNVVEFMTKIDSKDFVHQRVITSSQQPLVVDEQEVPLKSGLTSNLTGFMTENDLKNMSTSVVSLFDEEQAKNRVSEDSFHHSSTISGKCPQSFTEPLTRQQDATTTSDRMTHKNYPNQISRDQRTEKQCDEDLAARINELRNQELARQFKFMNL